MIAVTGASGFLGSAIAQALGKKGVLISRTRLDSTSQSSTVDLLGSTALDQLTDVLNAKNVDTIIHAAGITPWLQNPNYEQDIQMADVVARYCNTHAVPKLIYISGWVVYSESAEVPYSEAVALEPSNDYGKSKVAVEAYLSSHLTSTQLCIARPSTIYGPGQKTPGLITNFCASADKGAIAPAAIHTKRDYLFIDDFVSAMLKLCDIDSVPQIVNLGGGTSTEVISIAETIARIYDEDYACPVRVITPTNPTEATPLDNQLDIRIAKNLGLLPSSTSISEGLAKYIAWVKA